MTVACILQTDTETSPRRAGWQIGRALAWTSALPNSCGGKRSRKADKRGCSQEHPGFLSALPWTFHEASAIIPSPPPPLSAGQVT